MNVPTVGSHIEQTFLTRLRQLAPDLEAGMVRELRFCPGRRWRFDFAWPQHLVAVEADGGQWAAGGGRHNGDADRDKLNQAAARGWRVLRFSGAMLARDPIGCIEALRLALNTNDTQ